MRKIVYLGYVVPPDEANTLKGASIAGNKMQWNVIKELSSLDNVEIVCITVEPLAAYPKDKVFFKKYKQEELFSGVISHRVRFCNLPIIKQIDQINAVYRMAKKAIKEFNPDTLLCFNLFPQIGKPMRKLKKVFPQLNTVCLLADLPIDDNTTRKGISRLLRSIMEKSTWKSMQACDRYIVLNKHVINKYLPDKPYVVIDGGVEDSILQEATFAYRHKAKKNIVYGGALTEYSGILRLIEAMKRVEDKEVVLEIYGGGYVEEQVKCASDECPNIFYYGRLPNQEMLQKQKDAWLLVNPRVIDDPISQLTFPSKTFEYMLSGTPVLTTRLNGYSQEYEDKLFFTGDSVEDLANSINEIAKMDENILNERAEKAFTFIKNERSWRLQCAKVLDFMEYRV